MKYACCFTIFFAIINTAIALSVLALGVWLHFYPDPILSIFGLENVQAFGLALICVGVVFLFTMIIGWCSCCTRKRCALVLFCVLLVLHTSAFFGGGGALMFYKSSITNFTVEAMDTVIKTKYGFDAKLTTSMNNLQIDLSCCGGSGYNIYKDSEWAKEGSTLVPEKGVVPPFCCVRSESGGIIDKDACLKGDVKNPNGLYQEGCFTKMQVKILYVLDVSSIALLCFGGWLFIVTLVACCMCCSQRHTGIYI